MIQSKNKFTFLLTLMALVAISGLQSCKKYSNGPGLSFVSRAERVSNEWKVDNYKINGADFTSLVNGYLETYTKGGDYSYSWGVLNGTGKWKFQNNDSEIKLNGTDGQSSRTLTILKLEEKAFWYSYMEGNDKHELHLIEN